MPYPADDAGRGSFDVDYEVRALFHNVYNCRNLAAIDKAYAQNVRWNAATNRSGYGRVEVKGRARMHLSTFPASDCTDEIYWMGDAVDGYSVSLGGAPRVGTADTGSTASRPAVASSCGDEPILLSERKVRRGPDVVQRVGRDEPDSPRRRHQPARLTLTSSGDPQCRVQLLYSVVRLTQSTQNKIDEVRLRSPIPCVRPRDQECPSMHTIRQQVSGGPR